MLQVAALLALLAVLVVAVVMWRDRVKRPSISIAFGKMRPRPGPWTLSVVLGRVDYRVWGEMKKVTVPATWDEFKTEYTGIPVAEDGKCPN